MESVCLAHLN